MDNSTKLILDLIEKHKTTKSKVEKACGLSNGSIGKWQKGKYNPSYGSIVKIAKYFNVTTDYLLGQSSDGFLQKTVGVTIMAMDGDGQEEIRVTKEQYNKIKKLLEIMDEN